MACAGGQRAGQTKIMLQRAFSSPELPPLMRTRTERRRLNRTSGNRAEARVLTDALRAGPGLYREEMYPVGNRLLRNQPIYPQR
jgi:hypothetical protein